MSPKGRPSLENSFIHAVAGGLGQGGYREGDAGAAVQDCQEGDQYQHGVPVW